MTDPKDTTIATLSELVAKFRPYVGMCRDTHAVAESLIKERDTYRNEN
jgi:hypothetical protein